MGESKAQHLLVIRLSAMGDVAITSHAIQALHSCYPDLKITILTRAAFKPFFRGIDGVDFVFPDFKNTHKGLKGLFRLGNELVDMGVTHVADLHDVLRTKILRRVFKNKGCNVSVIDKGRREKRALTRRYYKFRIPLKTSLERYRSVFSQLGFSVPELSPVRRSIIPLSESILSVTSPKEGAWIGVAPFAQHRGKIYPLDLMTEVIKGLSAKYDKIFIFGGGEHEKQYADSIDSKFDNVVSVIGKMGLESELDLISNLDVMISMDSSALHMASLFGIPVVSVWGATHPYAGFYGFGQDPDNIVQLDLECRPCSVYGNKPCRFGDYRCMANIPPLVIVSQVDKVLSCSKK